MIKKLPNKDIERAIALVNKVFSEFVAIDYSEEGRIPLMLRKQMASYTYPWNTSYDLTYLREM